VTAIGRTYQAFLESKFAFQSVSGFEVDRKIVNPRLKPHVKGLVPWALKGGRRGLFLDFGLHKTTLQIELMRIISLVTSAPTLIVLPLGVRQEFFDDAARYFKGKFSVRLKFIRGPGEIESGDQSGPHPVYLTNYETVRDGKIDPALFVAASLDEAAALRDFGSLTYQTFLPKFEKVLYRFVATATPAPNRLKELIHYAAFLGIMDSGEALTRWFQRNSEKANDLTLYPHKEDEFWLWVHSWAVFLQKPSDLGYSDEGYELPKYSVHWHAVPSDHAAAGADQDGQGLLLADPASGVQAAAREKRSSLATRVDRLLSIVAGAKDPAAQWVLWADLNDEQTAIERGLAGMGRTVTSLTGSQDIEDREIELNRWKKRETLDFLSKPSMYGAGTNLQQAHLMGFVGVGYQFHDFIQAWHREVRFGQTREVEIHIVHSEAEAPVVDELKRKWREHDEMRAKMAAIIREHGLDHEAALSRLRRGIGVKRKEVSGNTWRVVLNDNVEEMPNIPSNSVGLIVTSIPFEGQYEYVANYSDFGHCSSRPAFWQQMDYLTPELFRVLQPGRRMCIHVKDRIMFGNVTGEGVPTVSPFHAEAILHYQKHGFQFMGMITVVTDVVRENNATNRLTYKELRKDSTTKGVGSSEYVLLMRKPQTDKSRGYADDPVTKDPAKYSLARWQIDAHAFWRSSGNRLLTTDELIALGPGKLASYFPQWTLHSKPYDYEAHVKLGEDIEARRPGALPRTFMALAPGSDDPLVSIPSRRVGGSSCTFAHSSSISSIG